MDKLANLPAPIKWFLGVTGLGAMLGVGGAVGHGSWKLVMIFFPALLVLLLLFLGGYALWNWLQRRKQNARLGGELQQSTTAAPRGMSATDLAKLDSLRKRFQEGVEAFRSRGKDLYTLPWYVIIGEPGSGKTEAVRHCNVGFPPGMHEGENDTGYMGAGGTINMNWWFTNYAVLLDTAGRLVFEEVKPGETSEWKEFLKLLKKNRPYCPINGLLLVIPSDSLIKDSADSIAAKAGKIAQQLDVIQRVLDFRFPVYVVITKSDKINGFREFFEGLTDPQLQHQMLGWANLDPLDSPFKPEAVDKHLASVADRLRRRRLGLMRDPVPESATRRTDEVDSLFALPNSLLMLAPRLRRYLETIFMPGQWSAKPLFLRGIYFTSSMREGASLDQELAEAIGVSADDLPEGKVWERDRAYFLRDLFMDKVFKEKGLVTRATNTGTMLRRRQLILYASCFVALAVFVVVGWLGMGVVRSRVKDRADYWSAARGVGWDENGNWNKPIVRLEEDGLYSLVTNRQPFAKMTLGEFHQKLRQLAEADIPGSWSSPWLVQAYNKGSKQSQRTVLETGVLKPLRDAVAKAIRNPAQAALPDRLPDVLAGLLRLESDVVSRRKGDVVPMDSDVARNFLGLFSQFVTGQDASHDTNLVPVMVWTYCSNRFGVKTWPPAWLSETTITNGVATNALIQAGVDYCIRMATNTFTTAGTNWSQVTDLQAALRAFERAENEFFTAVRGADRAAASKAMDALLECQKKADRVLTNATSNELFKGGMAFGAARQAYTNQLMTYAVGAFEKLERANTNGLRKHPEHAVFANVSARLAAAKGSVSSKLQGLISAGDNEEFARFDAQFLAVHGNAFAFNQRCRLYERAKRLCDDNAYANLSAPDLPARLDQAAAERTDLDKLFSGYAGHASNDVAAVGRFYLGTEFAEAFRRQAARALEPVSVFPLVQSPGRSLPLASLDSAAATLGSLSANVASLQGPAFKDNAAWKAFAARVDALNKVAQFLKGKTGPYQCTVSLRKPDTSKAAEKWSTGLRQVRVARDGGWGNPIPVEYSDQGDFQELVKVPITRPCRLQFLNLQLDEATSRTLGDQAEWGVLALLFKYPHKPEREGDLRNFVVECPMAEGGSAVATLKLTFEEPLPDLGLWPKN
jgi:hypothetical protein